MILFLQISIYVMSLDEDTLNIYTWSDVNQKYASSEIDKSTIIQTRNDRKMKVHCVLYTIPSTGTLLI